VNSLPKTVTRQSHGCDLNPGTSAPESSTLTTRLPSQFRDTLRHTLKYGELVMNASLAKTAEPIKMSFGVWTRGSPSPKESR